MKRYEKNFTMLSIEEHQKLKDSKVCVLGCGGLGGYIIEMLGRIGIGQITVVDGDKFDETNLNRQILSDDMTLGKSKAETAQKRLKIVNDQIYVNAIAEFIDERNVRDIIKNHDIVVDALDTIPMRLLVQETCENLDIPFVFGAIAGWFGQVSTIFPGDKTLNKIYKSGVDRGKEKLLGNPSFTPALVSSIQVSEVIKILIQRGELLRNKLLIIDTLNNEYETIDLT